MPTIPAGYAEATFIFRPIGGIRDATWSLGLDSANFGLQTPEDIAEIVYTAFTGAGHPYLATNMDSSWTFQGVAVTMQMEDGPLSGEFIQSITGSNSSGAMPLNCAMLMNKVTGLGGRRNKGRAYVPPVTPGEASVNAMGVIDNAVRIALQALYNTAVDDLVLAEVEPMLFHQSAPFTPAVISSLIVQDRIATQRRRLRR